MIQRRFFPCLLGIFVVFGFTWPAEELPTQISDETFWNLVTDFSEPGGTFISDNFVSNERTFQRVLSALAEGRTNRGVYLGVGPEQNFTYIVALKPKMAFIVDIRRQNMIEHLMYKALIEMSTDRADFISRLFSRQKPADLAKNSSVIDLFIAFRNAEPSAEMFDANLAAMKKRLVQDHGFKLTDEDEKSLEFLFSAF